MSDKLHLVGKIDEQAQSSLLNPDTRLDHAISHSAANGLPAITISALQGQYLAVQCQLIGAKTVLEVGTLGGYSTIWFASTGAKVTSIEINPKFSDTGEAYLVGLAVTDSPASLGTEVLSFAAQHPESNPFASRKQAPDNLFTAAVETALEFDDTSPTASEGIKLSDTVKNLLKRFSSKTTGDDARFNELVDAVETLAVHANVSADQFAAEKSRVDALEAALKQTTEDFAAFRQQVDTTDANATQRPAATGGDGVAETDF